MLVILFISVFEYTYFCFKSVFEYLPHSLPWPYFHIYIIILSPNSILLISPQGDHIPRSVRLTFSDHHRLTNNIVEYGAYITGLETPLDLGVRQLEIYGDSNLVIQ